MNKRFFTCSCPLRSYEPERICADQLGKRHHAN